MAFNEQKVLYDYELDFSKRLLPVLRDLGCARLIETPERQGREAAQPHCWLLGWRYSRARHRRDWRFKTHIWFDGFFYNEDSPDVGKPTVQMLGEPRVIYSRVIDSDQDYELVVKEAKNSVKEEWTEEELGVSFGVTNRTTVKAEVSADVGVAKGSASAENETITTFESSFGKHQGGKSSTNVSLNVSGKVTIPAEEPHLAYAEAQKQQIVTPYKVNGYIDHSVKLDLYDWTENNAPYLRDGKNVGRNDYEFPNLTAFRAFLRGDQIAEFPNMRNFLDTCSNESRDFYKWITDPTKRHCQFERQKVVVAEQATKVQVKKLSDG